MTKCDISIIERYIVLYEVKTTSRSISKTFLNTIAKWNNKIKTHGFCIICFSSLSNPQNKLQVQTSIVSNIAEEPRLELCTASIFATSTSQQFSCLFLILSALLSSIMSTVYHILNQEQKTYHSIIMMLCEKSKNVDSLELVGEWCGHHPWPFNRIINSTVFKINTVIAGKYLNVNYYMCKVSWIKCVAWHKILIYF